MNTEIKGVHVEITDEIRDFVDKKMARLDFAREYIIDMLFSFSQESREFRLEVNVNFRWGHSIHVRVDSYDMFEGIDRLFDKMEFKIQKEKGKVQEHKGRDTVRTVESAEQ